MLIKFDSFTDQRIQMGRLREAAMPADIAPSQVISDNEQDVWLGRGR
jgi:hypothetical protein